MLNAEAIATRLSNSDYSHSVLSRIVADHMCAVADGRRLLATALATYARTAAWMLANEDLTGNATRTRCYFMNDAVAEIARIY